MNTLFILRTLVLTFTFICFIPTAFAVVPQEPYNGPHEMPGRIEAEDFDVGGQDISYHDSELGKNKDANVSTYRSAGGELDVEILAGGTFSNGNKIGWMANGDWLEYTFNAKAVTNDDYVISVRTTSSTAANGDNKGYRLLLDGVAITGDIKVNPANGWFSEFLNLTSDVKIPEGEHVLRLEVFSTVNSGNIAIDLDYIQFQSKAVAGKTPLTVTNLISTNSVLQRNTTVNVWGNGEPGNAVSIKPSWGGDVNTTIDASGKWTIGVPTIEAGGPYTLTIEDDTTNYSFSNIMLGEVWVASGQSNMALRLHGKNSPVTDSATEIANSTYPNLRVFTVGNAASYDPEPIVKTTSGWVASSPQTSGEFSAVAYMFARDLYIGLGESVPIGVIVAAKGNTAGEAWTPASSLVEVAGFENVLADLNTARQGEADALANGTVYDGKYKINHYNDWQQSFSTPGALYNGQVAGLTPYSVKGVIWYQGENNAGRGTQYRDLFPALINAWRADFKQPEMPFYFVQIAPYGDWDNRSVSSFELREAQYLTQSLNNTGMAVILDAGEKDDIHPHRKQIPANRMALNALAREYGEDKAFSGPVYHSAAFIDGKAILNFYYVNKGLELRAGDEGLFQIAGADNVFRKADVSIVGDTLEVSSPMVSNPTEVRYAWKNWVEKPALYNIDGLPASSFRTSKGVTLPNVPTPDPLPSSAPTSTPTPAPTNTKTPSPAPNKSSGGGSMNTQIMIFLFFLMILRDRKVASLRAR